MIPQSMKRWLAKMFSWWPWKRASATVPSSAGNTLHKGVPQESQIRPTIDGAAPQLGLPVRLPTTEERPERKDPPLPIPAENIALPSAETAKETTSQDEVSISTILPLSSTEQHLAFLHYLVQRGIVNEGFEEGQEPEQYRRK
jgi:hypothetical protein